MADNLHESEINNQHKYQTALPIVVDHHVMEVSPSYVHKVETNDVLTVYIYIFLQLFVKLRVQIRDIRRFHWLSNR